MSKFFPFLISILVLISCKTPSGVFTKKTAHEQYGDKLDKLGLRQTVIGSRWFEVADKAILNSIPVQLPYKENGYFAADRPEATGLRFVAKRGEQLTIELTRTPSHNFLLFAELFQYQNGSTKFIQSIDSASNLTSYIAKENTSFILRIQPELLQSVSYMISVKTGPSLAFPVSSPTSKNRIISFWGDGRDKGARKHEGIDIGGALRTPVIAIGDGYVSSVAENNLGGKVIFIRAAHSDETWYYAHLDSQIANHGQKVKTGDVIGLMGNTGNARTTAPHLHFGIYTTGGAIDPLPYINPFKKEPKPVLASTAVLGTRMRISGKSPIVYSSPDLEGGEKVSENMPMLVTTATNNLYKVVLPGGEIRFIRAINAVPAGKRIKQLILKDEVELMDAPVAGSPVIQTLPAGSNADVLGIYGQFQYVLVGVRSGWISQK